MGNGVFEVLDAPFDKALLLFGSVVLGVLTQVTMGARFRDRRYYARAVDLFQRGQFLCSWCVLSFGLHQTSRPRCSCCRLCTVKSFSWSSARKVARPPAMVVV